MKMEFIKGGIFLGTNFILRNIKRANRNLLLAGSVFLMAALVLIICNNSLLINYFNDTLPYENYSVFRELAQSVLEIASVLTLIFLIFLVKFIFRNIKPKSHPIYKQLEVFGEREEIYCWINSEVADTSNCTYEKNTIIAKSWTLRKKLFNVVITRNKLSERWVDVQKRKLAEKQSSNNPK
jgi:hypothetical protein